MSDDLLHRATRALRDDEPEAGGTASTGHRWHAMDVWSGIVKDVRRARRGRRLALAGLGAWAAASGRLPALLPSLRPTVTTPTTPRSSAHRRRPAAELVPAEQRGLELAVPSPQASVSSTPLSAAPSPRPRVRAARAATATPPTDASTDPEVIYAQAHAAHFVRRDYAAALSAWDRYLALAPGPLTLEARYNRAIALVRLQRRAEASEALEPFAAGHYGGYRREEARALLKLLGPPQP